MEEVDFGVATLARHGIGAQPRNYDLEMLGRRLWNKSKRATSRNNICECQQKELR